MDLNVYIKMKIHFLQVLKEAINTFLINIATRYLRKNEIQHNSMLIHVSRFKSVQGLVFKQVKDYIDSLKKKISKWPIDKKIRDDIIKKQFNHIWINDIQKNFNTNKFRNQKIKFDPIWKKVIEDDN